MMDQQLRQVVTRLTATRVIPKLAAALDASSDAIGAHWRSVVLADVPAFSATANPAVLPGLEQHLSRHVAEVIRIFSGETDDFDFVLEHARLRAEQRFPLEATLHAYRCGERIISRWLSDAILATAKSGVELALSDASDFATEYFIAASSAATSQYVTHTRMLSEADGDRRTELLNILLNGYDESDGRVAQLLKRAGYLEQRQAYCVVAVQSINPAEMESPARALRIVNAVAETMAGHSVRVLAGIRNNLVTAILSDRRRISGWTAAQSNLADRVRPLLLSLGPAVAVGLSADHPSTSFLPRALHEAGIALDFANVAQRVVQFSDLPLRDLLIHRGRDYVQSSRPEWVSKLLAGQDRSAACLVETLRMMAAADMNVQQAARNMGKHPNTVHARLEKIKRLTGLDGQRFGDLSELLLAIDCWQPAK